MGQVVISPDRALVLAAMNHSYPLKSGIFSNLRLRFPRFLRLPADGSSTWISWIFSGYHTWIGTPGSEVTAIYDEKWD
jgi:hypothetical protein